ncbi:MAG: helix-turn-helix transcriptional regulator [Alphaproteobacteria bacterium]
MDDAAVLDLIGKVYDAAYDPAKWREYLTQLRAQTGSTSACLLGFDFGPSGGGQFGEMVGAPLEMYEHYEQYYWQYDEFALADARAGFAAGQVWNSAGHIPDAQLAAGEYFNGFLRPFDLFYFAGGSVVKAESRIVWSGALFSQRHGPADDEAMRLLELLMPHQSRALLINERMAELQTARAIGGSVIDQLPYGLIALDRGGRVLGMNRLAEAIVAAGAGLRLGPDGVAGLRLDEDNRLREAISHAASATAVATTLALPRPDKPQPLRVIVAPVPRSAGTPAYGFATPKVLLFLHDPGEPAVPPRDLLRRLYGLTPKEAELAVALARGADLASAAAALDITRKTAAGHLHQIFRKTGTRRQAELVGVLAAVPVVPDLDCRDP